MSFFECTGRELHITANGCIAPGDSNGGLMNSHEVLSNLYPDDHECDCRYGEPREWVDVEEIEDESALDAFDTVYFDWNDDKPEVIRVVEDDDEDYSEVFEDKLTEVQAVEAKMTVTYVGEATQAVIVGADIYDEDREYYRLTIDESSSDDHEDEAEAMDREIEAEALKRSRGMNWEHVHARGDYARSRVRANYRPFTTGSRKRHCQSWKNSRRCQAGEMDYRPESRFDGFAWSVECEIEDEMMALMVAEQAAYDAEFERYFGDFDRWVSEQAHYRAQLEWEDEEAHRFYWECLPARTLSERCDDYYEEAKLLRWVRRTNDAYRESLGLLPRDYDWDARLHRLGVCSSGCTHCEREREMTDWDDYYDELFTSRSHSQDLTPRELHDAGQCDLYCTYCEMEWEEHNRIWEQIVDREREAEEARLEKIEIERDALTDAFVEPNPFKEGHRRKNQRADMKHGGHRTYRGKQWQKAKRHFTRPQPLRCIVSQPRSS